MQIYNFKSETGEFLGETSAHIDPLETMAAGEDRFLIPANSTTVAPPELAANQVAVFSNGSWGVEVDFRGQTWFADYDQPVIITEIGDPVTLGYLDTEPQKPTPTNEDVNIERERRVNLVVPIYLSTGKVFAVDMADGGRANIGDLALMAVIKNGAGITTDFTFRDANDTDQTLTNDEVIEMGMQAAASYDAYYKKSWVLKALDPIPSDYTDDSYWT